jgi:hypothetical protein
MSLQETQDGFSVTFSEISTGRVCGSCSLCCRLLPLPSLNKAANTRCQHQRFAAGCKIYQQRPHACRTWSCRWLSDPDTAGLHRPDRSRYVIDLTPDVVTAVDAEGVRTEVAVVQVWCDPAKPAAWRDPALVRYIEMKAERDRMATVIRYDSTHSLFVCPPAMSWDRGWNEQLVISGQPA